MDLISSMLFSLPCPSKPDVTCSKSLYSGSVATTTVILSHMSLLGVTAALNRLTKNRTLAKILGTGFSNPFGLLIFGYVRSS